MSNSVTAVHRADWQSGDASLYIRNGARKYLNRSERLRAIDAMKQLPAERALFAQVLAWTGARVSEVLALTPMSFQIESGIITIVTLKRRKFAVREVPIPPWLMASLDCAFALRQRQRDTLRGSQRIWGFCRMTAWRIIKRVMASAEIVGPQACPKGFRHGFGVGALHDRVPLTMIQRLMGHAKLATTSIYLEVAGPDAALFLRQFWRNGVGVQDQGIGGR